MKKMEKSLLILLLILSAGVMFSQETSKITPYISLQYFKNNNDSCYLKTTLTYSKDRMEMPLPGMKINFYQGEGNSAVLAEKTTDDNGTGIFYIGKKETLSLSNGLWPFSTSFTGNDSIEPANAEIAIRDASLTMETEENDSIRTISLKAEKLENGKMVPASGEALTVYVPRMFSFLPLGEVTLDDEGFGTLDFPSDLPGDKDGNVVVIARFEEHPEFGNIEKTATLKWGVPLTQSTHLSHRALWTKTAPRWMIYTLSILLTGVWGHYLFAIISLVRIKLDSRKKVEEKEMFIK
jgi:hypothetical protein